MSDDVKNQGSQRYLIFKLGTETYATPLLGVREVVEYQEPKQVPNSADYCLGVINIRGEIVGVIDLRKRLGFKAEVSSVVSMLVFSTEVGSVASVVDQVEAVADLQDSDIDRNPNVMAKIPMEYLIGIGRYESKLITLIDLSKIIRNEELTNLRNSKLSA